MIHARLVDTDIERGKEGHFSRDGYGAERNGEKVDSSVRHVYKFELFD